MSLVIDLYYDKNRGQAKPGVFEKPAITKKGSKGKAGSRRLLKIIIPRLKKTFDIHDMTTSEIIDTCGDEVKTSKWVK